MKIKHRARIDWSTVRERLAQNELALERSMRVDPDRLAEVFRKRAVQFAARRAQTRTITAALRVLVFAVGEEQYGIELKDILGVRPFTDCTPVPSAPPEVRGIVHLHGELRTVVDFRRLVGLADAGAGVRGYILRVRWNEREIGLLVDEVEHVRSIAEAGLADPRQSHIGPNATFVKDISPDGLIVLNVDALFSHPLFADKHD
jgi:purine-binding chemotaxis protein CheW